MIIKLLYPTLLKRFFFIFIAIPGLNQGAVGVFAGDVFPVKAGNMGKENHNNNTINSCQIALVPHQGQSPSDNKISAWQKKIAVANNTQPYLENLAWAYIQKARESFDDGFYLLARHTAYCMQQQDPESLDALLITGHVHHSMHEFRAAQAIAQTLIDKRGRWFDYALSGDVLMEQGQLEQAVGAYQQMMDLKPGPQAYSRVAHVRWLTGDLDGAIELMSMAAQSAYQGNRETLAWFLSKLSLYQLQAKRYTQATENAQTALSLFPDYAPAHLALSRIHLVRENWDKAIEYAGNAVDIYPQVEPLWILYEAYSAAGHSRNAMAVNKQLARSGKVDDPRTYSLYLSTLAIQTTFHTRNTTDSQTAANRLTANNPTSATTQAGVALDLARQELANRADVHTVDALAWALTAAGFHRQAYATGKQIGRENTQDARFFYHLSVIAHRAGHTDEAIQWRSRALQLKHMLLPSEKRHLDTEFATASLQKTQLTKDILLAN